MVSTSMEHLSRCLEIVDPINDRSKQVQYTECTKCRFGVPPSPTALGLPVEDVALRELEA